MPNPTCSTGCENALAQFPGFKFSDCAAITNAGEIEKIYLGLPGQGFTSWASATEWNTRLAATDETRLVALTVIGEKPRPTSNVRDISGGRKVKTDSDHVLNFTIDETGPENHQAIRQLECGGTFTIWYETSGGLMFGDNGGIRVSVDAGMVVPLSRNDLLTYQGSMSWKARFTEDRITSPIA